MHNRTLQDLSRRVRPSLHNQAQDHGTLMHQENNCEIQEHPISNRHETNDSNIFLSEMTITTLAACIYAFRAIIPLLNAWRLPKR